MNFKKYFYGIFLSIITCGAVIGSISFQIPKNNNILKSEQNSTVEINNNDPKVATYNLKVGNLGVDYTNGWNIIKNVSNIYVSSSADPRTSSPDDIFKISFANDEIAISMGANFESDIDFSEIDKQRVISSVSSPTGFSKNFFNITQYDAKVNAPSYEISNTGITNINKKTSLLPPSDNSFLYNPSFLLQMSFTTSKQNTKYKIKFEQDTQTDLLPDSLNSANKCNLYNNEQTTELIFTKSSTGTGVDLYIPTRSDLDSLNSSSSTGASRSIWNVNKNDQQGIIYNIFNDPISLAYNKLTSAPDTTNKNANWLKDIVSFEPELMIPSMNNFDINLIKNASEGRIYTSFGNNQNPYPPTSSSNIDISSFSYLFHTKSVSTGQGIFLYSYSLNELGTTGWTIADANSFKKAATNFYIDGFNLGTYLKTSIDVLNKNRFCSSVTEEELKTIILNALDKDSLPTGFTVNNIILQPSNINDVNNSTLSPSWNLIYDNKNGEIKLKIVLDYYKAADGTETNDRNWQGSSIQHTISGFKKINPTSVNQSNLTVSSSTIDVGKVTNQDIIDIIIQNQSSIFNDLSLNNPPTKLNPNDIIIDSKKLNYVDGSINNIQCHLVNNFLSDPYALPSIDGQIFSFTIDKISGYKKCKPTIFNKIVTITNFNGNSQVASDYGTSAKIIDLINNNKNLFFQYLPNEQINIDNTVIDIKSIVVSNTNGQINCHVTWKSDFYDSDGSLNSNYEYDLVINGFTPVSQTVFATDVTISSLNNKLASDYANFNKVVDLMNSNKSSFFSNLPNNNIIIDDTVISISGIQANNLNGTLTCNTVTWKSDYYDVNGNKTSVPFTYNNLIIKQFKQVVPTSLSSETPRQVNGTYTSLKASDVNEAKIKEIIKTKSYVDSNTKPIIKGDLGSNFDYNTNIVITGITPNNLSGSVTFNLSLNGNYFDTTGNLVTTGVLSPIKITFNGFSQVNQTTFTSIVSILNINQSNNQPASYYLNKPDDIISWMNSNKNLFFANLVNPSININNNIVSITNIQANNKLGELTCDVNWKADYYDQNGNVSNGYKYKLTIQDFKKVNTTEIIDGSYVVNGTYTSLKASDVNEAKIKEIIKTKSYLYSNTKPIIRGDLDSNFDYNTNIVVTGITPNNLSGSVSFNLSLNGNYFDNTGNLVTSGVLGPAKIIFSGFSQVNATIFNTEVIISDLSNVLASDKSTVAGVIGLMNDYKSHFFSNLVNPSIKIDNNVITIGSITSDNLNGTLTCNNVVWNSSYNDQNGNLVSGGYTYNIVIKQFRRITPTSIGDGINKYSVTGKYTKLTAGYIQSNIDEIRTIIKDGWYKNATTNPIIKGDLTSNFSYINNLIITKVKADNLSGTVVFEMNINSGYYNNDGMPENSINNLYPNNILITLDGFYYDKPTEVVSSEIVTLSDKDLAKLYPQEILDIFTKKKNGQNITPNELVAWEKLQKFLYDKVYLYYKEEFVIDKSIVIFKIENVNNLKGTLSVTCGLLPYMDAGGHIISSEYDSNNKPLRLMATKIIEGFNQVNPTIINPNIQVFDVGNVFIGASNGCVKDKITIKEACDNNEILLKEIIMNYNIDHQNKDKKIICGDIPLDFSYYNDISITVISDKYNESLSRLVIDISLNKYYDSFTGIEQTWPSTKPVRITLEGFKSLPKTNINGQYLSKNNFFTNYSDVHNILNVNIRQHSTYANLTAQGFLDLKNIKYSSNLPEINSMQLDQFFGYTNVIDDYTIDDILVVFNPDDKHQLKFDGMMINNVDNKRGVINITARAIGYFYDDKGALYDISQEFNPNSGNNYAYIQIQINNFVQQDIYYNESNQPYIVLPIIWGSTITIAFIAIVIYVIYIRISKDKKHHDESRFIED